jgi:hypothetical protein
MAGIRAAVLVLAPIILDLLLFHTETSIPLIATGVVGAWALFYIPYYRTKLTRTEYFLTNRMAVVVVNGEEAQPRSVGGRWSAKDQIQNEAEWFRVPGLGAVCGTDGIQRRASNPDRTSARVSRSGESITSDLRSDQSACGAAECHWWSSLRHWPATRHWVRAMRISAWGALRRLVVNERSGAGIGVRHARSLGATWAGSGTASG